MKAVNTTNNSPTSTCAVRVLTGRVRTSECEDRCAHSRHKESVCRRLRRTGVRYGKQAASGKGTVVGLEISLGTVSSGRKVECFNSIF